MNRVSCEERFRVWCIVTALVWMGASTLNAQIELGPKLDSAVDAVDVSTTWSVDVARPGDQAVLAVVMKIREGYHLGNAANLIPDAQKAEVMPTAVELNVDSKRAANCTVGNVSFPGEQANGIRTGQIKGQVIVYVPVTISQDSLPGNIRFDLQVSYQACNDKLCFAPKTIHSDVSLELVAAGTIGKGCPAPELFTRWSDRRASLPANKSKGTDYKSKQPPIGPPWVRDLATAQSLALKSGRPIFLYSTKTFCPHCVIVESEMLSSPALKTHYDDVVWLYVYRDFTGGEADRVAERIGDRFSLSSWPQLWLVNPHDLSTIGETGRSVESFAAAVAKVDIPATNDLSAVEKLTKSESELVAFDRAPTDSAALQLIKSDDVVAQLAAARYLSEQDRLEALTDEATTLLSIPNDGLRYEVLKAIATTGQGDAAELVARLVERPEPSRNYNVLRSYAIKALASCGDKNSLAVIAPFAKGTARNSTTRVAIDALVKLAQRYPDRQAEAVSMLADSFPPIEKGVERLIQTQAKMIHEHLQEMTGRTLPFPAIYDRATREELIESWNAN